MELKFRFLLQFLPKRTSPSALNLYFLDDCNSLHNAQLLAFHINLEKVYSIV